MKNFIAVLFFSFLFTSAQVQSKRTSLPVNEFEQAISSTNVQILDVRTAGEYNSGHLKKALQADWYNQQQFTERTAHMDKSKPVYVYCLTGIRSAAAVKQLKQKGFLNIQDLKGGLTAWKLANKPVEGTAKVKQITLAEYKAQVQAEKTVLVDFGAGWCPPCKKMEPVIAQLKNQAAGKYKVVNIDASVQIEIMKQMRVESLPVFIVYKNGKEVWRRQGMATLDELKTKLL